MQDIIADAQNNDASANEGMSLIHPCGFLIKKKDMMQN
jgi:hypothetical protein